MAQVKTQKIQNTEGLYVKTFQIGNKDITYWIRGHEAWVFCCLHLFMMLRSYPSILLEFEFNGDKQ